MYRHSEVHRANLYVPKEETLLVPMTYVGVVKQTQTSIIDAIEHTLDEYWNAESEVALSEEWMGTTKSRSCGELPQGYTTYANIKDDTTRSGPWNCLVARRER